MLVPGVLYAAADKPKGPLRHYIVGSDRQACIFRLSDNRFELQHRVDIGFKPHSFLQNPLKPNRIWTIQRYDNNDAVSYVPSAKDQPEIYRAVEFDLHEGVVTREIKAAAGSKFRGHGFFAPDSGTLFISRVVSESKTGSLTGYDVSSDAPKMVADYSIGKTWMHDCVITGKGEVFAAAAGLVFKMADKAKQQDDGYIHSGVTQLDLHNGKVLSHTPVESDIHSISHLSVSDDGIIVACGKSFDESKTPGGVFVGRAGEAALKLVHVPGESAQDSEKFGLALNEKQHMAAVTDYVHKHIVIFDLRSGDFMYSMPSTDSVGLLFDPVTDAFISNGNKLNIFDCNLKTLLHAQASGNSATFDVGHALIIG